MPKRYPEEFRRKVLDLVVAGRPIAQISDDLGISDQTIYWRKQELIDTGQLAGLNRGEQAEQTAANKGIREVEAIATTAAEGLPVQTACRWPSRATTNGVIGRPSARGAPRPADQADPGRTRRPRPRHETPTATDLAELMFTREAPNRLWVNDITEHRTYEGEVYCAVVLDTFSRRVVGWSIDSSQTAALVTPDRAEALYYHRQRHAQTGEALIGEPPDTPGRIISPPPPPPPPPESNT